MTRAVFSGHRVRRLHLVFLAVIPASGTNLSTALEQYRSAAVGIQDNTLHAGGGQA